MNSKQENISRSGIVVEVSETAKPAIDTAPAAKPNSAKDNSGSTLPLSSEPGKVEKALSDVACGGFPFKMLEMSDEVKTLLWVIDTLRGLDEKAWQACEDAEWLEDIISELVHAGIDTLEVNDAAKARGKAA